MARTSPSPTRCQFSLDQTRRRLSMCGVRKSWDASHQSTKRQNDDLLSLCEETELSSLRLSCILSFLVLKWFRFFCLSFFTVFALLLSLGSYYSRRGAGGLCSRTLICDRIVCWPHFITPVNPATWAGAVVFVLVCLPVLLSHQ
jgi:hypothetical protein